MRISDWSSDVCSSDLPRRAEHPRALRVQIGDRGGDVGHLEAEMVLPARRVLLQECRNRRVLAQRFEQFDLAVGRIDAADAHLLRGQIERLADLLRAQQIGRASWRERVCPYG